MNILIINGSPRKKGLISQMLSIMQEEAETRRYGGDGLYQRLDREALRRLYGLSREGEMCAG